MTKAKTPPRTRRTKKKQARRSGSHTTKSTNGIASTNRSRPRPHPGDRTKERSTHPRRASGEAVADSPTAKGRKSLRPRDGQQYTPSPSEAQKSRVGPSDPPNQSGSVRIPQPITSAQRDLKQLQRLLSEAPPEKATLLAQSLSLPYYLSTLQIVHPTLGRVPWQLYPYQSLLASRRPQDQRRIIVKSRQIGVSQYVAGEAVWLAKFNAEREIVFISRNGPEAKKLIGYAQVLCSEDPQLQDVKGTVELKIPALNFDLSPAVTPSGSHRKSKIVAEAASQSAGRGGGKLAVYGDEFAHGNFRHWGTQIWQSIMPGVTHGGHITFLSTPGGKGNMFFRLYSEAIRGLNGFTVYKFPWYDCPAFNPYGFHLDDPEERERVGMKGEWYEIQRPAYDDAAWAEEFGCDFVLTSGLIYGDFNEAIHVGDYPYNPSFTTYAGIDFGYINPAVALIIQVDAADNIYVIREHYKTNVSVGNLGKHYYKRMAREHKVLSWKCDPSDPASIKELEEAGIHAEAAPKLKVNQGIQVIRRLLRPPDGGPTKIHVDRSCIRLITDLSTYAVREGTDEPEKDIADHGPDALRYFVVSHWKVPATRDLKVGGQYVATAAPLVH